MPWPRLIGITSINYVDTDGVSQTLASSEFQVDTSSEPGRIAPEFQKVWPETRDVFNEVTIVYTDGYGAAASDVPESLKTAIKITAGSWYENREHIVIGKATNELPFAAKSLLWSERMPHIL